MMFNYTREASQIVEQAIDADPELLKMRAQFIALFEAKGGRGLGSQGASVCIHALGVLLNKRIPAGPPVTSRKRDGQQKNIKMTGSSDTLCLAEYEAARRRPGRVEG